VADLLFFFETDCPTCRLMAPYLNAFGSRVEGISQDSPEETDAFVRQLGVRIPVKVDAGLTLSRHFDPEFVPALYKLDPSGAPVQSWIGFAKADLNALAAEFGLGEVAPAFDGNPAVKPGCTSRHREVAADAEPGAEPVYIEARRASRIEVPDSADPWEAARELCGDPLPVVPPTVERVERLIKASGMAPDHIVALVPPNYGPATVEKIAANGVMAGCDPGLMRVLIPLVRAACDERFNLHGVQATTHFAAPLVILNGSICKKLELYSKGNAFSNVARSNSTLGRAFQLILTNIGGARPGEIDMSTLGNPGKFSYVIAENEEESPWDPLHLERGIPTHYPGGLTLFAAEPPRAVSEHTARRADVVLDAICDNLANVWSPRACGPFEAFVVICPEHAKTISRDGFSKQDVRQYLWSHTGVPKRRYETPDGGEGTQMRALYEEISIHGEICYRKFKNPDQIQIVVCGGTAGKFSAVIGSWATGERGSQIVTYPIE
ncbi:MAG: TlpA disulfide reductase family protein, partial [Bryobacteraceae bacterium]